MGVGQLLQTAFNWSLAIVRFMSMDQKPEINIVIVFLFKVVKQGIDNMP